MIVGDWYTMVASEQEESRTLDEIVAENPEEVEELVRRLDTINNILEAMEIAPMALDSEAAEDAMEGVEGRAALLAESGDALINEDTPALAEALGSHSEEFRRAAISLAAMERAGLLDDLAGATREISEMGDVSSLLTDAARTGMNLQDNIANEDLVALLDTAMGSAARVYEDSPPKRVGTWGLLKALRDRDVQTGIGFTVELMRELGRELRRKE